MSNDRYEVGDKGVPAPEILPDAATKLDLFDLDNPDKVLFNSLDQENIRLSGSKMHYYRFLSVESYDPVYMESRNKVHDVEAVLVAGFYDPTVLEKGLGEFGIEFQNDQVFTFNRSYIINELGREPIAGDIIHPVFQNQKYEIFQVQEDEFQLYGIYHLNCHAKLLRDSDDVVDIENPERAEKTGHTETEDPTNRDSGYGY